MMSSRRPPLPRLPRRPPAANLLYDCSMLRDDETVFLVPTNHDNRRSSHAHHHHHQAPPPDPIQWLPRFSYSLDESVILNPVRRRIFDESRLSAEAIAKYIEIRVVRDDGRNDAVGGEDEDGLCVVCQDEYSCEEKGRVARLDCGHQYHVDCINNWLSLSVRKSCPLCNTTLLIHA